MEPVTKVEVSRMKNGQKLRAGVKTRGAACLLCKEVVEDYLAHEKQEEDSNTFSYLMTAPC